MESAAVQPMRRRVGRLITVVALALSLVIVGVLGWYVGRDLVPAWRGNSRSLPSNG